MLPSEAPTHKLETRCPHFDCSAESEFLLESPPDPMRPLRSTCPHCSRPASFRDRNIASTSENREQFVQMNGFELAADDSMVAVIEDVRSLWNVGSIFRTSDGSAFSRLFLTGICGNPPRKEISKVSLGAEDWIKWHYCARATSALSFLKDSGAFIVGLEKAVGSTDLNEAIEKKLIRTPLCLVVGNEVNGLSEEALWYCDIVCHLPMRGNKESLNVAVAYGIAAYSLADGLA